LGASATTARSSDAHLHNARKRLTAHDLVLYFGDYGPEGLDIFRDIAEKLPCTVKRIAVTKEQVEEYGLTPSFAKATSTRYKGYVDKHGEEVWELDALPPDVLRELVRSSFEAQVDILRIVSSSAAGYETPEEVS
jgi:hypothetical protein